MSVPTVALSTWVGSNGLFVSRILLIAAAPAAAACSLCAAACPANCIYIEAAENTESNRISSAERYAQAYNIDYSRCIFCGYCVEACPTDAITHGHGFELATYNINSLVYRKEQLLESLQAPRSSR